MGTSEKVPIFAQIVPRKGITVPSRALPMRVRLVLYGFVYSLRDLLRKIPFLHIPLLLCIFLCFAGKTAGEVICMTKARKKNKEPDKEIVKEFESVA